MGRSLETMLRGLVQVVDAPPYTTVGENPTWVQRHVLDYAAALESCYERRHAPYILHLEDDMLPAPNWWPELMDALKKLNYMSPHHEPRFPTVDSYVPTEWFALRLFYTEKFHGYEWTHNVWFLVRFLLAVGVLQMLTRPSFLAWALPERQIASSTVTGIRIVHIVIWVACFIASRLAGRQNVHPVAADTLLPDLGGFCCSQTILYQSKHVPDFVAFLRRTCAIV
jgi:hypothetical protein